MEDKLKSLDTFEKDSLVFIFEELFEKVEREVIGKKIEYFQKYFIGTLNNPIREHNFDERRFFLDVLGGMSLLECELLRELYNYERNQLIQVGDLRREGIDQYAIVGSINRLKSYGFLIAFRPTVFGGSDELNEKVELSPFGLKFYEFCIKS